MEALQDHLPADERWIDRDDFDKTLSAALRRAGVKVGAPVKKAILSALSERDEEAQVCTDKPRAIPNPTPICATTNWCR
jgi:type I restriction enzyme M protein